MVGNRKMAWTILIIIAGAVFIAGIIVSIASIFNNNKSAGGSGVDGGKRKVTANGGVSTKKLTYGQDAGAVFEPGLDVYGTVYHGGGRHRMWEAYFEIPETGKRTKVAFPEVMAIGRRKEDMEEYPNLVIPEDKLISGMHCILSGRQGILTIHDAGSLNHTYLNGKRVTEPVHVPSGSLINIGNTNIRVSYIYH